MEVSIFTFHSASGWCFAWSCKNDAEFTLVFILWTWASGSMFNSILGLTPLERLQLVKSYSVYPSNVIVIVEFSCNHCMRVFVDQGPKIYSPFILFEETSGATTTMTLWAVYRNKKPFNMVVLCFLQLRNSKFQKQHVQHEMVLNETTAKFSLSDQRLPLRLERVGRLGSFLDARLR